MDFPPRTLRIGPHALDAPVVQAALSGYSDAAMRLIARRLGASYVLCEVMLDQFLIAIKQRKRTSHLLHIFAGEHPVGGQLMGADPADFGPAAGRLVDAGFDVIDINFGCPVKKVLGRCRGGYHLSQPEVALDIVQRVRDATPPQVPVTVKMRRGLDDSAASEQHFFTIFDGSFQRGAAAITVHGRTVRQRYDGPSNWDFLKKVKRHAGQRTVLGSGDLFSARACLEMLAHTGVDGVTVARGAIGNPWIFAEAAALLAGRPLPDPPTVFAQREVIEEHFHLAEQLYGAERCVATVRKFGVKYSRLHPQGEAVRDAFVACKRAGQWREVLAHWYAEDASGIRPPPDEANPLSSEAAGFAGRMAPAVARR